MLEKITCSTLYYNKKQQITQRFRIRPSALITPAVTGFKAVNMLGCRRAGPDNENKHQQSSDVCRVARVLGHCRGGLVVSLSDEHGEAGSSEE